MVNEGKEPYQLPHKKPFQDASWNQLSFTTSTENHELARNTVDFSLLHTHARCFRFTNLTSGALFAVNQRVVGSNPTWGANSSLSLSQVNEAGSRRRSNPGLSRR